MDYLAKHRYQALTLERVCQLTIEKRPFPENSVVLTFDDGFRNNCQVALPILKRFGFTATVFVVTGCVGKRMTWTKTDDILDLEMASWDEIRQMSEEGVEIQAHSVTHPNLLRLSNQEIREEICASKAEIESRLGKAVTVFAYPYGEFSAEIAQIVAELGFIGAVTLTMGMTRPGDDPYALKRMNVTQAAHVSDATKMLFFECCVTGMSSWYSAFKHCLPMLVQHNEPWKADGGDHETETQDRSSGTLFSARGNGHAGQNEIE